LSSCSSRRASRVRDLFAEARKRAPAIISSTRSTRSASAAASGQGAYVARNDGEQTLNSCSPRWTASSDGGIVVLARRTGGDPRPGPAPPGPVRPAGDDPAANVNERARDLAVHCRGKKLAGE